MLLNFLLVILSFPTGRFYLELSEWLAFVFPATTLLLRVFPLGLQSESLSPEAGRGLVLPLHSFLRQVGSGYRFPSDASSLQLCSSLVANGSSFCSDPGFSPWDRVELNDRSEIYPVLLAAYKNAYASRSCPQGPTSSSLVGVSGVPSLPDPGMPSPAVRSSLHGKSFRKKSPTKKK